MKRICIITILAVICGMTAMAQNRPDMAHQNTGRDRGGIVIVNAPVISYDENTQLLTVTRDNVNYFELTITSVSTQEVELQEVYNGTSAMINVSFLTNNEAYLIEYLGSDGFNYSTEFVKSSSWTNSSISSKTGLFDTSVFDSIDHDRLQRR